MNSATTEFDNAKLFCQSTISYKVIVATKTSRFEFSFSEYVSLSGSITTRSIFTTFRRTNDWMEVQLLLVFISPIPIDLQFRSKRRFWIAHKNLSR